MIFLISRESVMKLKIRIWLLHLGHSSGSISKIRFMQAAQLEEALARGSGSVSARTIPRFFLSPRARGRNSNHNTWSVTRRALRCGWKQEPRT